jgi:ribosomal protein L13
VPSLVCLIEVNQIAMLKKLKVYGAETHPHSAQQPKALEI